MRLGLEISFHKDALLPAKGLSDDAFHEEVGSLGSATRAGLMYADAGWNRAQAPVHRCKLPARHPASIPASSRVDSRIPRIHPDGPNDPASHMIRTDKPVLAVPADRESVPDSPSLRPSPRA